MTVARILYALMNLTRQDYEQFIKLNGIGVMSGQYAKLLDAPRFYFSLPYDQKLKFIELLEEVAQRSEKITGIIN